jgi:TnpA family transposase
VPAPAGAEPRPEDESPAVEDAAERLPAELDAEILRKYFTLTDGDLGQIAQCRGAGNKLGFGVQLCTLRWRGHFLADTREVPAAGLEVLARQLGLLPMPLIDYPRDDKTRAAHLGRIRQHLGFVRCDPAQRQRLLAHLTTVARAAPRTAALRKAAQAWLLAQRVVRPGRTTLRDLVTAARETGLQQLYDALTGELTAAQRSQLDSLLATAGTPSDGDGPPPDALGNAPAAEVRSPVEGFKVAPRRESPTVLLGLLERLQAFDALGFTDWPPLAEVHPAARRLLAGWGNRYNAWSLRRFPPPKRHALLLCFLQAALAETADAVVEAQDKLITSVHAKAKKRREALLRAGEEAKRRAVEVLGVMGELVLDDSIPDAQLRSQILGRFSSDEMATLVDGCQQARAGDDGSHLGLTAHWYGYTREYSPALLEKTPFRFAERSALGRAVEYLRLVNREHRRKLGGDAPTDFLPPRWRRHVVRRAAGGDGELSRPHYELALLTTLNEQLKSGDVTVARSRRWTDFEDYLIPRASWGAEREQHYAALGLPLDGDTYLTQLEARLHEVTAGVDARVPHNQALTIDRDKGEFHLARLKASPAQDAAKRLKDLLEARLPKVELVDLLIDLDRDTDFLRHFLQRGEGRRTPAAVQRRNVLAALVAVGCNLGPSRLAAAAGLSVWEISQAADWALTEEALKAANIDLVNFATHLPMSAVYGRGDTCSADGMRFYVPVDILAADYSNLLRGRGVTLYAHTAQNATRFHQQPIPCRLREATFVLDGLVEHDTELDPRTVYTDTHGYTEVVMATAALLGTSLAPRIARLHEQTLYKLDRSRRYAHLDPILDGTIKPHLIRRAWDEAVRVVASIQARTASPSLLLHRLGSYARQHSVHQALNEIGRAERTVHLLRTLDDEEYRRQQGRELNKGEAGHDLARFLFFGKEGALRGRGFEDQFRSFSCLGVLHNAVVAWNLRHVGQVVAHLRAEGHPIDDATLALTTPLLRKHLNPFGRYHFDLERLGQTGDGAPGAPCE